MSETKEEDVKVVVRSATISHGFDTHKAGLKAHHFVSMNVEFVYASGSSTSTSLEEAHLLTLKASEIVTKAAIDTAIARGAISVDEANDRIKASSTNHKSVIEHREKQLKSDV